MSNKWSSTHNGERSSLKEFISQSQAVWRNLQLGAPLCIAGGDKGMPSVPEIWSSSLLWCGMRIRSCAETQTHDSRVIDCFAADTSADRPHCFYSLLRFLSPPNNNHFRLSSVHVQLLFQDDWLWWTINRIIACVNTSGCLVRGTEGRIERCLTDTSMVRRVPTIRWFIWSCSNPSRCQLSVMTNRWGQQQPPDRVSIYESQETGGATGGADLQQHRRVPLLYGVWLMDFGKSFPGMQDVVIQ